MRKEIIVKIPYYEKGQELEKEVKIFFVSNRVLRDYNVIMKRLNESLGYYGELKKLDEEIGYIVASRDIKLLEKRAAAKPFVEEIKAVKKKIKADNEEELLKDRFDIIKRILTDNECKDKSLFDISFWDNKTEVSTSWGFLTQAAMKDTPEETEGKKKAMNLTNPS